MLGPVGLAKQISRIEPVGQNADPHIDRLSEEKLDRTVCGSLSGFVAIEHEHHHLTEPLEDPRVILGQCGPQRGHDLANTRLMAGDDVRVAFGHDDLLAFDDRSFGKMQAVECARLVEHHALGAVEILRLIVGVERSAAERNRPAQLITDRKDQPIAERVVVPLALRSRLQQPGADERFDRAGFAAGESRQAVPLLRRRPEHEGLYHWRADAALLNHVASDRRVRRTLQRVAEE